MLAMCVHRPIAEEPLFGKSQIEMTFPMMGEMKTWYADPEERGRRLRALTTTFPGGADQLFLELWEPGEFDGWDLVKRVEVKAPWVNNIELLGWDGERLHMRDAAFEPGWSEAAKRTEFQHFTVSMTFERLGRKAHKAKPTYYDL